MRDLIEGFAIVAVAGFIVWGYGSGFRLPRLRKRVAVRETKRG